METVCELQGTCISCNLLHVFHLALQPRAMHVVPDRQHPWQRSTAPALVLLICPACPVPRWQSSCRFHTLTRPSTLTPTATSHTHLRAQVVSPSEQHGPSTHALALQHASASLLLGPSGEVLPHSMPSTGYPTFKFGPSEEAGRRRSRGSPEGSPRGQEDSLSPVRRSSQVRMLLSGRMMVQGSDGACMPCSSLAQAGLLLRQDLLRIT